MPRYFFDVYDDFDGHDAESVELADLAAMHHQVRQTLPSLVKDIKPSQDSAQFRVDVRAEAGHRVVTSTILMVMQCIEDIRASKAVEPDTDHSEAFH